MMSRHYFYLVFAMVLISTNGVHAQKKVYVPESLRGMDLASDTSQWSFQRSIETPDLIFMWEKGFGQDLNHPPLLDGKPMAFRLDNIRYRAQQFYHFFRDTLGWVKGPSKADRYKMMVMIKYSLDSKAYGGSYDNFIGALWVTPNFLQNEKMNAIAHELGHCFQFQIVADSVGQQWINTGFKEMTSQWMLWQVNPDWVTDEIDHLAAFRKLTHKAFLHKENIYHSPYVIQWWSDLHGRESIAELYRQHRTGEDAATTYMRMYGLDQGAFCDEMFRGYQHLVNFDFQHARRETRPYACTFDTELEDKGGGWLGPKNLPEDYGFNAILLDERVDLNAKTFKVRVKGDNLRYGFVGVTLDDECIYGAVNAPVLRIPKNKQLRHLYLVVMGAPQHHEGVMATRPRSPMRMRGVSSTKGSNAPLIVVNGDVWETDTKKFNFSYANKEKLAKFLNVNPEDIVSIAMIKGAAATDIWGSQGSNGVIEIKTVSGYRQYPYMFKISY